MDKFLRHRAHGLVILRRDAHGSAASLTNVTLPTALKAEFIRCPDIDPDIEHIAQLMPMQQEESLDHDVFAWRQRTVHVGHSCVGAEIVHGQLHRHATA